MTRYIYSNCSYVQNYQEGTYTFTGPCRVTGKLYSVTILGSELWDLNQGALLQDALKTVNAEDREFVCTGTSPEGWEKIFA